MNDIEKHIATQIRLRVWSGFCDPDTVQELITDILEPGADEDMLRLEATNQFEKKQNEEQSWADTTDCDRLLTAFEQMNESGLIALRNSGWDKSEAFHNCLQHYRELGEPPEKYGICYYTEQDVDSAIEYQSMHLGYSSTRPETEEIDALRAGEEISKILTNNGIEHTWGGDAASRIELKIEWKFRNFSEPTA